MNKLILFAFVAFLCISLSMARPGMKRSKRAIDKKLLEDFVRSLAKKSDDDETHDDEKKCVLPDQVLQKLESKYVNDEELQDAVGKFCGEVSNTLTLYPTRIEEVFKFLHVLSNFQATEEGDMFLSNVVALLHGVADLINKEHEGGKKLIETISEDMAGSQRKRRSVESGTENSDNDCVEHLLEFACQQLGPVTEEDIENDFEKIMEKGKQILYFVANVLHSMNTIGSSGIDGAPELMYKVGSGVTELITHIEYLQNEMGKWSEKVKEYIKQLKGYKEEDDTDDLGRALKEFVRKYMGQKNRK